jgi:hypothetical protein
MDKATQDVKTTGRAWEDSDEPIQDAMADRDAADDVLDLTAQQLRTTLAGRALGADKTEPYTRIFPRGVGYYTAAPLDDEENRYGELKLRCQEHLGPEDPGGKATCASIDAGLKDFRAASDELRQAQNQESLAGTRARSAIQAFVRQLEKTYGALLVEIGKAQAERFFPKTKGSNGASNPGDPSDPAGK